MPSTFSSAYATASPRDRQHHDLGLGNVAALAADPLDLVTCPLPQIHETTADATLTDYRDPH
jgi:hypothetical protein